MSDLAIQSTDEATLGLSQWQRITNTFTAPSKTFEDIQRGHKSWWLPFILLVAATYILFAAITFQVGWGQVVENTIHFNPKTEARLSQLTPEQRASTDKMTRYFVEGTFIASPLLTLAEVALLSVGLWGTINFAFGGKAKFGSIFTVWMYASLPSIVTTLFAGWGDHLDPCAIGDRDGDGGGRQAQLRLHSGLRMVGDLCTLRRGDRGHHWLKQCGSFCSQLPGLGIEARDAPRGGSPIIQPRWRCWPEPRPSAPVRARDSRPAQKTRFRTSPAQPHRGAPRSHRGPATERDP
jgi:hypothetical protein